MRLGAEIAALEGTGAVGSVLLKTGERIAADLVVAGFGVTPATDALDGVTREQDGSINVDATLQVTDNVFAAGDIAAFPYRESRIRVEHWRVAQQQGRLAALNMLGHGIAYSAPPVFWTIQYMKRLDYVGHADDWDEIVLHGDLDKPEFIAYYVKNDLVAAAVGMDRDRDMAALVELFAMRSWTTRDLGERPSTVLEYLQTKDSNARR